MTILKLLRSVTVEPVLFLYMMLIMLESNALRELIYTKSCLKILSPQNASDCRYETRQNLTNALEEATFWNRYYLACLHVCTLLTSFYVASWSDRIGRRILMLIPLIGTFIAAIINCTLSVYLEAHITYLFVSATISGLTFGLVGIIASTFGYIADLTTENSRTLRIVILEAMIFIGGTCGIEIGGLFLKNVDFSLTFNQFAQLFIFQMCVAAAIVLYIFIRIPSHLNNDEVLRSSVSYSCSSLFSLQHIQDSFQTIFKKRPDGKRKKILLLLLALIFVYIGSIVNFELAYYFVKNEPLKWSFSKYSIYNSLQFGVEGAALLIALPIAMSIFRLPDCIIGILGTLSRILGFVMFGMSKIDAMVYSCAALFIFAEFPIPVIRSILSKTVDKHEKGKIFAFSTILQNLSYLCGSLIFNTLFQSTISFFPGLSFELVACLHVITLLIFCYLHCKQKSSSEYDRMENETTNDEDVLCTNEPSGIIN